MNETQRKAYLNAMGIDVYYPRFNLPGTAINPHYEIDPESINNESNDQIESGENHASDVVRNSRSNGQANLPAKSRSPRSLRERIEAAEKTENRQAGRETGIKETVNNKESANKDTNSYKAERSTQVEELATAAKDSTHYSKEVEVERDDIRFALRYYRISDFLSVIEEYPLQQAPESRRESLNLLRNILLAINVKVDAEDFSPDNFNWPLAEGLNEGADEKIAAKQALQGFIMGRRRQDEFQNLLVFAGKIEDLLIAPNEAQNSRDFKSPGTEFFTCITHSLQSMLSYPDLKKDVWQQLQALRQRSLSR